MLEETKFICGGVVNLTRQARGLSCEVDRVLLRSWLQEGCADLTGLFFLPIFCLGFMLYGSYPIDY